MKLTSKQLISLAITHNGEYHAIKKAIANNRFTSETNSNNAITILDTSYPSQLRKLDQPPYVLFYKGDIEILKNHNRIAVIGSRNPSEYGEKMTVQLVENLTIDIVVVSGLAKGID